MAPDTTPETLHIRCGSDLKSPLQQAGFVGGYLEWSDPLCQGPVSAGDDWLDQRAEFLWAAYGKYLGRDLNDIADGLRRAEDALGQAAERYERVVLWFEHDSYDQLILARCLARFAKAPPRRLEMISIDDHPEPARFVGLGQLSPGALRVLWDRRQPVSPAQIDGARRVWAALRAPDPRPLMRLRVPKLPFMARALRRHCQEFPGRDNGLSLTERLVLGLLNEQPRTMGQIFHALVSEREPLPFLGDIMLRFILDSMKAVDEPVFTFASADPWYRETLTITPLGRAVLAAEIDYLKLHPPERWLGGVRIPGGAPVWRWDDKAGVLELEGGTT